MSGFFLFHTPAHGFFFFFRRLFCSYRLCPRRIDRNTHVHGCTRVHDITTTTTTTQSVYTHYHPLRTLCYCVSDGVSDCRRTKSWENGRKLRFQLGLLFVTSVRLKCLAEEWRADFKDDRANRNIYFILNVCIIFFIRYSQRSRERRRTHVMHGVVSIPLTRGYCVTSFSDHFENTIIYVVFEVKSLRAGFSESCRRRSGHARPRHRALCRPGRYSSKHFRVVPVPSFIDIDRRKSFDPWPQQVKCHPQDD